MTSCPDKQQLSSSAVAANVSLIKCLELEQAALLRDTLTALKKLKKTLKPRKKTWYAEKMGNGLCRHSGYVVLLFAVGLSTLLADTEEWASLTHLSSFIP